LTRPALSRRRFLAAAAAAAAAVPRSFLQAFPDETRDAAGEDGVICEKLLAQWRREGVRRQPVGELLGRAGRAFLGAPYKANTLQEPGEEHLVVNLREFDCVTFYESCLALARCYALGKRSAGAFRAELRRMRYRGGAIQGYPSRLHYFSDWVRDNVAKKIVTDATPAIGGEPDRRILNFMSSHPASYGQLAAPEVAQAIAASEGDLSAAQRWFLPKSRVEQSLPALRTGDIIGITTSIEGLDCSHTGLAVEEKGVMKFLHAPLSGGVVQFSRGSLADYLAEHEKQTGIIVARPVAPVRR
jgi:hypothetical protein